MRVGGSMTLRMQPRTWRLVVALSVAAVASVPLPASGDDTHPSAGASPEKPETWVHFQAVTPDTGVHIRPESASTTGNGWTDTGRPFPLNGATSQYSHVCIAPCDARIPAGRYHLALSPEGGESLVEYREVVALERPSIVTGAYRSRAGLRVAGWLMTGVAIVSGAVMVPRGSPQIRPTEITSKPANGLGARQVFTLYS
jgi:hypothetical protein